MWNPLKRKKHGLLAKRREKAIMEYAVQNPETPFSATAIAHLFINGTVPVKAQLPKEMIYAFKVACYDLEAQGDLQILPHNPLEGEEDTPETENVYILKYEKL